MMISILLTDNEDNTTSHFDTFMSHLSKLAELVSYSIRPTIYCSLLTNYHYRVKEKNKMKSVIIAIQ